MTAPMRILVVGCGKMGGCHARAYHKLNGFEIVGLVSKDPETLARLSEELGGLRQFEDYEAALTATQPDAVSINTYPDTHASFCIMALRAGCHVFVEKPLATTVEDAEAVVKLAAETNRKVLVGYILRVHPVWQRFIETAKTLGKPLVMRMSLNQQSFGDTWRGHKNLMNFMSPIVDCGVHYVDVMCQMTGASPVHVHAIGARLTDEVKHGMYNYGHLHVTFEDGSVGWYEAGWGPMMSQVAYFVKDVIGPKGSVSIAQRRVDEKLAVRLTTKSRNQRDGLWLHYADLDGNGQFARRDASIRSLQAPDQQTLCCREQELFLRTIREDLDLTPHLRDAVNSLRILLAADQSYRTGQVVDLSNSECSVVNGPDGRPGETASSAR
jgi:predicted dehydrogenase